jgi:DNA-binding MarR family transcriptional regulator
MDELMRQLADLPVHPAGGLTMAEVLSLPEPFSSVIVDCVRHGSITQEQIAEQLGTTLPLARQVGDLLAERGYLQLEDEPDADRRIYRVYLSRIRPRSELSSLLKNLDL